MRAAVGAILVAALAIVAATTSGAASSRYAKADVAVVEVDGDGYVTARSRRDGEDQVKQPVDLPGVSIRKGVATARTGPGAKGLASAVAYDLELLDGRIKATGVRRETESDGDGTKHRGGVYALAIDGQYYGDFQEEKVIQFDGGKAVLNRGDVGLHVTTGADDIAVGVAHLKLAGAESTPTPTATATSTATAAPYVPPATNTTPSTPPSTATTAPRKQAPTVKRRLTQGGYAFPVYSDKVRVADNFGASRAKPIVVHQGVDIFAPFGSPVVAVRDGRLSHVGTLPISGNRLWLHTANGDAFFYAHLSAFSNLAKNGAKVKAGQVLGFTGNTGDAEPTPPHVHFEVHPGGMNEDAVDPYPIVTAWQKSDDVPPGAWLQQLGADATERPGALVTVRDFIAE